MCVNDESQEMHASCFTHKRKCATCWPGVLEQIFWYKIQVATCHVLERQKSYSSRFVQVSLMRRESTDIFYLSRQKTSLSDDEGILLV